MNQVNRRRLHAVMVARSFKQLLQVGAVASILLEWLLVRPFRQILAARCWAYRSIFTVDGWRLRLAAHHVLGDLRDFCFAQTSAFDPDPIIMARRQGRRDVWLRISNYLNLDEEQVQKLMEIDDGIG